MCLCVSLSVYVIDFYGLIAVCLCVSLSVYVIDLWIDCCVFVWVFECVCD